MITTFKDKERRLRLAIATVRAKLESFKILSESAPNDPQLTNWNNWHDLEDRLTDRLIDNWKAFKSWHWDTYQFNAY